MRRFQCTNRNLLSFDFGSLYNEVSPQEAKNKPVRIGWRSDSPSIFLQDKFNDIHALSKEWVANNFKELPEADLVDDPFMDHEACEYRELIPDTDGITWRGILTWCAVGFMVALSILGYFWIR